MKVTVAVKTENRKWQIGNVVAVDCHGEVSEAALMKRMKEKWPDIVEAKVLEATEEEPIDV